MPFKTIETSEEFERLIAPRLERAERKAREKYADYEELKSKAAQSDAALAEVQRIIEEKTARLRELEFERARMDAAHGAGLPFELMDTITGETKDELARNARKIARHVQAELNRIRRAEPLPIKNNEVPSSSSLSGWVHSLTHTD